MLYVHGESRTVTSTFTQLLSSVRFFSSFLLGSFVVVVVVVVVVCLYFVSSSCFRFDF